MNYAELKERADNLRNEVIAYIEEKLNASESKVANFVENAFNDPVVFDNSDDDAVFTLDRVYLKHNNNLNRDEVALEYSNSYTNDWNYARNISLDVLLEIAEEMSENEGLYEEEDEDE